MALGEKDKTHHPIYVIYGKDRRRVSDELAQLTDQLLAGADPQLALSTYEASAAELADVLDGLCTLPFLSPIRIVVIKEADPFISKYRQQIEEYLQSPCKTGILVLMAESFPSNTRLAKLAKKIVYLLLSPFIP